MFLLPLSYISTGIVAIGENSTFRLLGHILFFEITILIGIPIIVIALLNGSLKFKMQKMDILIVVFMYATLVPSIVYWDTMYESLRVFRHTMLSPVLVYFMIRVCMQNAFQIRMMLLSLIPAILLESLILINYFLSTGMRVENHTIYLMSKVILSVAIAWGLAIIVLSPQVSKSSFGKLIHIFIFSVLAVALIASAGRMATFSLIIGLVIIYKFFKKKWFRRVFNSVYLSMIAGVFIIPILFSFSQGQSGHASSTQEERYSISRLASTGQLVESLGSRTLLWKQLISYGSESPLYGHGLDFTKKLSKLGIGHSHNLYINTFVSSGVLGLSMMIMIMLHGFNLLHVSIRNAKNPLNIRLTQLVFQIGFTMMLIGFSNDYIGGLYPFFYVFLALAFLVSKLVEMEASEEPEDKPVKIKKIKPSVLHLKSSG